MATFINVKNIFYCLLIVCAGNPTVLFSGNGFSCCSNKEQFEHGIAIKRINRGKRTIYQQGKSNGEVVEIVRTFEKNCYGETSSTLEGTVYFPGKKGGMVPDSLDRSTCARLEKTAKKSAQITNTVILETAATFGW